MIGHYYLSQWVRTPIGEFAKWMPPNWANSSLDLRNNQECSRISGDPDRHALGLFVTDKKNPSYGVYIGDTVGSIINNKIKRSAESALNLTKGSLTGTTAPQIIAQLLTEWSDPIGVDRWRPLVSSHVSLCGCDDIYAGDFHKNNKWLNAFISSKQHDFRSIYQDLIDGKCHENHPGMVLDYWSKRYQIDDQQLVPSDIPKQKITPHSTIVGDTFTDVNGISILLHTASGPNGGFSWSAINGVGEIDTTTTGEPHLVTASTGFLENNFRAEGVVSGDDHYAKAEFSYSSGGNHDLRIYTRFDANSWTGYLILADRSDSSNTQLFKVVNGSGTLINNYNDSPGVPLGKTYRLESNGNTHTPSVGGVVLAAQTDTTITGNFRGGVGGKGSGTRIDNYEFSDLINASISSIQSPIVDGSSRNYFESAGFSGDVTSATLQSPIGDYPISVSNLANVISSGDGSSLDNWTPSNATLSLISGAIRVTSVVGGIADARHSVLTNLTIGQSYLIRAEYVTDGLTGSVAIKVGTSIGSVNTALSLHSVIGAYTLPFTATATTHYLSLGSTSTMTAGEFFDWDNISIDNLFVYDIPNVAGFTVNTPGSPFDSASHSHTFTANYLSESASTPIVINPQSGWQVVEVVSAITTPGSVFEGFGVTPVDGDQVYWPTANNTIVSADGTLATDQVGGSIGMRLFNTDAGEWQLFTVVVGGAPPVIGEIKFINHLVKKANQTFINKLT